MTCVETNGNAALLFGFLWHGGCGLQRPRIVVCLTGILILMWLGQQAQCGGLCSDDYVFPGPRSEVQASLAYVLIVARAEKRDDQDVKYGR